SVSWAEPPATGRPTDEVSPGQRLDDCTCRVPRLASALGRFLVELTPLHGFCFRQAKRRCRMPVEHPPPEIPYHHRVHFPAADRLLRRYRPTHGSGRNCAGWGRAHLGRRILLVTSTVRARRGGPTTFDGYVLERTSLTKSSPRAGSGISKKHVSPR